MKKATGVRTTRLILDQLGKRKPTKRQREEIAVLAVLPDDQIDTSDIPEITSAVGWIRNPLLPSRVTRAPTPPRETAATQSKRCTYPVGK